MKYNFTVKRYKLDFKSPYETKKFSSIVNNYVWTFIEFCEYVTSNNLSMYIVKSYFLPFHKVPYHDYQIGFTEKVGNKCYFVHDITVNKIVGGKIVDFNWSKFEDKLISTDFFKSYKIKRQKRDKDVITHNVVGI